MYFNPQERMVFIRFSHEVPIPQPVDITINDQPVVRGLTYRQMSSMIPLQEGMYTVKVYAQNQLLLSQDIDVDENKLIKITPDGEEINLVIEKEKMPQMMQPQMDIPYQQPYGFPQQGFPMYQQAYPQQGMYPMQEQLWQPQMPKERDKPLKESARVRFVHLSPNAPAVDITLPNGSPIFENIPYKGVTAYRNIVPGSYTLLVRPTGTDDVVLTIPTFNIAANEIKTVYAIGLVGGTPPLEVFVLNDRITR